MGEIPEHDIKKKLDDYIRLWLGYVDYNASFTVMTVTMSNNNDTNTLFLLILQQII